MGNLYWLSDSQMACLKPFFSKNHGKAPVDDWRVLSGIMLIDHKGLLWRGAPWEYGPHKTLYSHWKSWSDKGVIARSDALRAA